MGRLLLRSKHFVREKARNSSTKSSKRISCFALEDDDGDGVGSDIRKLPGMRRSLPARFVNIPDLALSSQYTAVLPTVIR